MSCTENFSYLFYTSRLSLSLYYPFLFTSVVPLFLFTRVPHYSSIFAILVCLFYTPAFLFAKRLQREFFKFSIDTRRLMTPRRL